MHAGGKHSRVMKGGLEQRRVARNENSRDRSIRYVVCFERLLQNKLLLKVEMFTSIENRFTALTGNYSTASPAVALSSPYVSLTHTK